MKKSSALKSASVSSKVQKYIAIAKRAKECQAPKAIVQEILEKAGTAFLQSHGFDANGNPISVN